MCGRGGGRGPSPSPAAHLRVPEGAHGRDTWRLQELHPKPVCGGPARGPHAVTRQLHPAGQPSASCPLPAALSPRPGGPQWPRGPRLMPTASHSHAADRLFTTDFVMSLLRLKQPSDSTLPARVCGGAQPLPTCPPAHLCPAFVPALGSPGHTGCCRPPAHAAPLGRPPPPSPHRMPTLPHMQTPPGRRLLYRDLHLPVMGLPRTSPASGAGSRPGETAAQRKLTQGGFSVCVPDSPPTVPLGAGRYVVTSGGDVIPPAPGKQLCLCGAPNTFANIQAQRSQTGSEPREGGSAALRTGVARTPGATGRAPCSGKGEAAPPTQGPAPMTRAGPSPAGSA